MSGPPVASAHERYEKLLVVDHGRGMPAALVSRLLADLGADVVRVGGETDPFEEMYPAYPAWRRGQRRAEPDELVSLLKTADVCILGGEDHPDLPPAPKSVDLAALNPAIVILEMSGFGPADPQGCLPAVDLLVQARTGAVWEQDLERPYALGASLPTYGMVLQGVIGVWCALIERLRSGRGQVVSTSLLQGGAMYWSPIWLEAARSSPAFERLAPKGVRQLIFQCADGGWVQLAMGVPGALAKLYQILGAPEAADPLDRGAPDPARGLENYFGDTALIARHVKRFPRAELLAALWRAGFAAEAVLAPGEVWDEPQSLANGLTTETAGVGRHVRCPLRVALHKPVTDAAPRDTVAEADREGPLRGLKVLDFGAVVAGPYASALLADLGADVIKVEPLTGDFNRRQARTTVVANRRKRSLAVDAKTVDGARVVAALCATANAVHHNFRVGVAERLGLDPAALRALRADLVTLETSAYGPVGPKAELPGFDMLMQALCGHEMREGGAGNPPHCSRAFFVDFTAGALGAIALLRGLFEQLAHGRGGDFATSLLEAGSFLMSELVRRPDGMLAGAPVLDGERAGFHVWERIYAVRDGWIAIALRSDAMAARLAGAFGIVLPARRAGWGEAERETIAATLAGLDTEAALALLRAAAVWAEPCVADGWRTLADVAEVNGHPLLARVVDGEHGEVTGWLRPLFSLSRSAVTADGANPALGEHTDAILGKLGYSSAQIADLRARRVVA